jgi:hypothetical protein
MRSWPIDWGCLPAGRWINAMLMDLLLIRGSPVPQRLDDRGQVTAGDRPVVPAVPALVTDLVAVQNAQRGQSRSSR